MSLTGDLWRRSARIFGVLLLVTAGIVAAQRGEHTDSVVASINGNVITQWDVAIFNAAQEQSITKLDQLLDSRRNAAERLIDQEVIWSEFKRRGWQVPNEAVDRRIDAIVAASPEAQGDYRAYEDLLAERRMTMADFRERVRKQIAVEMFLGQIVDNQVNVPPAEVTAYYEAHKQEMAVAASCVIARLAVPAEARDKLEKLVAQGKSWQEIVAAFPKAKVLEVEKPVDELTAEWRQAFDTFQQGAISKAFAGDYGIYVLYLKELRGGGIPPLAEVRDQIEDFLAHRLRQQRYRNYVADLRRAAYIRRFYTTGK